MLLKVLIKYNSKKVISFVLLIIILITLFNLAIYILNIRSEVSIKQDFQNPDITKGKKCLPINKNFHQHTVKIDGFNYPRSVPLFLNRSINFDCLNQSSDIKKILFWNSFFGQSSYGYDVGKISPFVKKNCPVTSCELITDKTRINESDLVLVHLRDGYSQFPSYRPKKQRWVFVLYESPVHSADFTNFNGFFNMTSTYKIDSDFPGFYEVYSGIRWAPNNNFDKNKDYLKNKTDFAAAVISNCGGTSGRLGYIRELQKHISVTIYGQCGKPCPAHAFHDKTVTNCKEIISYQYKFYFAFENSICNEYVTEKFFQILRFPIIPVVLGAGQYDYFVSKHTHH